ncbi:MAG: hypothetical protein JXB85_09640 [Anaerolineales bacterium]|nr:hypothetical protein [Anaerolineales bacterium]
MIDFQASYPPPEQAKRADGSSRFAFVTFLIRNDSFLPGALVFAHALHVMGTQADLVCLASDQVSPAAREALGVLYDHVVEIPEVFIPHKRRQERQDRPFLFTRFHSLRLGHDGDLGLRYDRIVVADADILPLRCYDHLFTLDPPAGILNEDKQTTMEYDEGGQYILPASVEQDGKWKWHAVYEPVCPHGTRVPQTITDRVRTDPTNMGINSSLFVLHPSQAEFEAILEDVTRPEIVALIGDSFNWPEMQYATLRWSGQWTNLDLRYSSFNGYPHLAVLCGTHFAGYKPWKFKQPGTIQRFSRFPDYTLWFETYTTMMNRHPALHRIPRLTRLQVQIKELQHQRKPS